LAAGCCAADVGWAEVERPGADEDDMGAGVSAGFVVPARETAAAATVAAAAAAAIISACEGAEAVEDAGDSDEEGAFIGETALSGDVGAAGVWAEEVGAGTAGVGVPVAGRLAGTGGAETGDGALVGAEGNGAVFDAAGAVGVDGANEMVEGVWAAGDVVSRAAG
jgi:hypothetical protein